MLCWFSELNPELMEELKTLRSEYAHLREFESKRGVDSVQRLKESYDDAKRLSEKFEEQFFQAKSTLEETQHLPSPMDHFTPKSGSDRNPECKQS